MTEPLASDRLESLLPALRHVAEMVQKSGALGREDLELLLMATGLADDWAVDELERWAKVLTAVRDSVDASRRELAQRALMLRGVPEAAAMLAVAAVSGSVPADSVAVVPAAPAPVARLAASVASLDFGTLPAGQSGVREFEVTGGPGQVVVDSDQVQAAPAQFTAGPTGIRVEVRSGGGSLLWVPVKLVSAAETVEVPVIAQWEQCAVPGGPVARPAEAPAAAPSRGGTITVAVGGSGDYHTLHEAVEAATPGATIRLGRGPHYLGEGLPLTRPITLLGEGMDATEVIADSGVYVLSYEGSGLFRLRDMTLQWGGTGGADVVRVSGGRAEIAGCRLRGGLYEEDSETQTQLHGGYGLWLGGSARVAVTRCACMENGSGICICQNASGLVSNSECAANQFAGIEIRDRARPNLEANECRENSWGIQYTGGTGGTAKGNRCMSNRHMGICVSGQSQPILEGNECRENSTGLEYFGESGGTARDNHCIRNEHTGIQVNSQARPVLEGNECRENRDGIGYLCAMGGTAERNRCVGNEHCGIVVRSGSQSVLDGNECIENAYGICYEMGTGGSAKGNRCVANKLFGIDIWRDAHPTLEGNDCHDNGIVDVKDQRSETS